MRNSQNALSGRDVVLKDFLRKFDLTMRRGVEIGPYDRPMFPRSEYPRVEYADVFNTEELRRRAASNPRRNVEAVVTVDHVLLGKKLSETIAPDSLDFVFCSHVLEHVPDLIGELKGIERILRSGGLLLCAYPDRRFTFDIDRAPTSIATLRARHAAGATRPDPETVFDFFFNFRQVVVGKLWLDLPDGRGPRRFDPERAAHEAKRAAHDYVDVHTTVVTDAEMMAILGDLAASGELGLHVGEFKPTAAPLNEFFFALMK